MLKVYDEVESLSGIAKLGGECEIYDEPESSNEGGVRLSFFPRILAFLLVCFFVPFAAFASPAFLRPCSNLSSIDVPCFGCCSSFCLLFFRSCFLSFVLNFFLAFLRACLLACLLACLFPFLLVSLPVPSVPLSLPSPLFGKPRKSFQEKTKNLQTPDRFYRLLRPMLLKEPELALQKAFAQTEARTRGPGGQRLGSRLISALVSALF